MTTELPDLLTDPSSPPPAPASITYDRGRDLWDAVAGRYALRQDELVTLEHACRVVAICDNLAAALVGKELVVKGSMGQPAAHPLLGELRAHRSQLAALLKQLNLPDELTEAAEPGEVVPMTASDYARRAARARWDKHRSAR